MNEQAFLTALHDCPGDPVTRAALADWLAENDQDDRSELTRLTATLITLGWDDPDRAGLEKRLCQLINSGVMPSVPEIVGPAGIRLALIPPGTLRMMNHNISSDVVIAEPYYMGVFAITQGQWFNVMRYSAHGDFEPSEDRDGNHDALPVSGISSYGIMEFIRRLNSDYDTLTYRLPTVAEWEYACRAGTTSMFCYGDTLSAQQANFMVPEVMRRPMGRLYPGKRVVGSYNPNAFGLYDIHGNVSEYCLPWRYEVVNNRHIHLGPVWHDQHDNLMPWLRAKGGSWMNEAIDCSVLHTEDFVARSPSMGLRVACVRKRDNGG